MQSVNLIQLLYLILVFGMEKQVEGIAFIEPL